MLGAGSLRIACLSLFVLGWTLGALDAPWWVYLGVVAVVGMYAAYDVGQRPDGR